MSVLSLEEELGKFRSQQPKTLSLEEELGRFRQQASQIPAGSPIDSQVDPADQVIKSWMGTNRDDTSLMSGQVPASSDPGLIDYAWD